MCVLTTWSPERRDEINAMETRTIAANRQYRAVSGKRWCGTPCEKRRRNCTPRRLALVWPESQSRDDLSYDLLTPYTHLRITSLVSIAFSAKNTIITRYRHQTRQPHTNSRCRFTYCCDGVSDAENTQRLRALCYQQRGKFNFFVFVTYDHFMARYPRFHFRSNDIYDSLYSHPVSFEGYWRKSGKIERSCP